MKKKLINFILLSALFFHGCAAASQNDIQTLKIRVINLETILQQQVRKNQELEKRVAQLEKKVSEGMADKLLNFRTQIMKELEDLKDQLTILSAKIEDLEFKYEELNTEYANSLKDILNQLKALSLKVAFLEKKLGILAEPSLNITTSSKATPNVNISINATTNETTNANNTTLFNNTATIANIGSNVNTSFNKTTNTTSKISPTNATNVLIQQSFNKTSMGNQTLSNQTIQEETKILKKKFLKLKESSLYQKGYNLFEKKDYSGALKIFQEYVKKFPKGKWIGQAYFWIGECYFNQGDYEDAILSYQKLIEMPGWHPQKPLAIFRQAQAFKALGDEEAYEILLKKLIRQYPYTKEAAEARKLLNL